MTRACLLIKIKELVASRASTEAECVLLRELAANEEVRGRLLLFLRITSQYRPLYVPPLLFYSISLDSYSRARPFVAERTLEPCVG